MHNNLPVVPRGSVLEEIMFKCILRVGESEEVKVARDELERLVEEASVGKEYPFGRDLENAATELYHLYGERLFMWGWHLRGNPDLLGSLSNEV
jgi:hypothetical protein